MRVDELNVYTVLQLALRPFVFLPSKNRRFAINITHTLIMIFRYILGFLQSIDQ